MDNESLQKNSSRGRDFLTYLCYQSDAKAGAINLPGSGGERFSLWVDRKIVLEDDRDPPPNTVTYSGDDFTNQDLKQAIRAGKKVREARFRIEKGENTWTFTFRADRFEVAGLKLDMPATDDVDEQFYARIYSVEALNTILDACYEHFVDQVCGKTWKQEGYPKFQEWLQAD